MTVSTLILSNVPNGLNISTISTASLTANTISTNQLVVSTISIYSFLTNQAVFGPTIKKTSMVTNQTLTIASSGINAQLDNGPSKPQVYTFGPTIQNRWVAVGDNSTNIFAYSDNGVTWTGLGSPVDPTTGSVVFTSGYAVEWNGNRWIAGGEGNNSIAKSLNGITWYGIANSITLIEKCYGVVWGTRWVAVGSGPSNIIWSDDGDTWTPATGVSNFGPFNEVKDVAYNGNIYVVCGFSSTSENVSYSLDGKSWVPVDTSSSIVFGGFGIAWNGRLWVIGGIGGYCIWYSINGINWTEAVGAITSPAVFTSVNGIAWNGTMWIAAADGSNDTTLIGYSFDGIYWSDTYTTAIPGKYIPGRPGEPDVLLRDAQSVTWNGLVWGIVARAAITMGYSYDGINWYNTINAPFNNGTRTSGGFDIAYNYHRPYTLTFPINVSTATIGSISPSYTFPITISQNGQLDICSDSYYNGGYNNFSMTVRGQYS
jgi:hypothetical protein